MHKELIHIYCLKRAAESLHIPYTIHDKNGNVITVHMDKGYLFVNSATPFNTHSITKLTLDKEFTYHVLHEKITMPHTLGFFDPHHDDDYYARFKREHSYEEILTQIEQAFNYPLVVKMNHGSCGRNVFVCRTREDSKKALKAIYNKKHKDYDYVALAQPHIDIQAEYRVIIFRKKILLLYKRDSGLPLHWFKSGKYKTLHKKLKVFLKPLFKTLDIGFAGLDIILDKKNKMYLLEINAHPGFAFFEKQERQPLLIRMYRKILLELNR